MELWLNKEKREAIKKAKERKRTAEAENNLKSEDSSKTTKRGKV